MSRVTHPLHEYPNFVAFTIDDVFTKEECQRLIDESEAEGYEKALVNVGGGRQELMEDVRSNDRYMVDDEDLANEIFQRVKEFLPQTYRDGSYDMVSLNERLRFLRYKVGQEFRPHFDGNYIRPDGPRKGEVSWLTLMLYLNDVEKGGETTFWMKEPVHVNPKTGQVIVFQHNVFHSGAPVLSGFKYVIRTDVMFKRSEDYDKDDSKDIKQANY